jgi:hypothetical protein
VKNTFAHTFARTLRTPVFCTYFSEVFVSFQVSVGDNTFYQGLLVNQAEDSRREDKGNRSKWNMIRG